jgi:uncharacterized protein (DUF1697 family)
MAQRWVALLRGINVGRARRVAMADLRRLLEKLGFREVSTLLNSGNVVFTSPKPGPVDGSRIEQALARDLGVPAGVVLLDAGETRKVLADNPLLAPGRDPSRLLVAVPRTRVELRRLAPLVGRDRGKEAIALGTRAAYLWCPDGVSKSAAWEEVNDLLGDAVTSRNWATFTRLGALLGE